LALSLQKPFKTAPERPNAATPVFVGKNKALAGTEQRDGLAIYVHWPWCLKKCPYCDFNSHAASAYPSAEYVAAVCQELAVWRQKTGHREVVSVFFGGGTPSLMKGSEIGAILAQIGHLYGFAKDVEITAECNPTSALASVFTDFQAAGINRVSVGTQGLSAENLAFLGREHSAGEALQTLENARKTFGDVNADLIFGLPDQRLDEWLAQLQRMSELGLPHLSCYQLTIEPNTAFFSQVRRGQWAPLDGDRQADFMEATRELLQGAGYGHYETSNYAKPGMECKHNTHIWRYGQYLGVGAGAHGRVVLGNQRLATRVRKDPADYLNRMKQNSTALVEEELIPDPAAWREAIMLGLRLAEGIDMTRLERLIHSPVGTSGLDLGQMGHLRDRKLLWQEGSRWGTTPAGVFVLDGILEAIFPTPL
jgi:oxygen-independent coproporphyrinogen-3 oxidase